MKTLGEHVTHLKTKPHHVRKRVAVGVASVVTGLVAIAWLAVSISTNAFAIQGSTFAESTSQGAVVQTVTERPNANLAGAAATVPDTDGPSRIEIVNVATTSSATSSHAEPTIIPF
ncbi:hypothetical protein COU19_01230 [Candidatus Kaiserbacteria bacterium CG10_big_fil_rev_8_21_14_0_10_56_12]|uniref:Uncharacterized protein n=1 Tax=Candidatus Kaiserbacteria bacterium CG10_big_fil_rev_8_21_14_0_10_56_12 TaxID=1974611 RepID=A0A2H0UAC6_9BACT|nr:MAG: hypothetical protein COU19_01230 [Candidatus Kaiserbacteria bacterium CG10_big_fil_rev_8_21_14_0_10_56_12]